MIDRTFTFKDAEGIEIFTYNWLPDETSEVKGVVQIAHGMAETAVRYRRFAEFLTRSGYIVYAHDQRGHGKTAGSVEKLGYCGEDGFNWMIKDIYELNSIIKESYPDLPVFLFGHSMGSFLTQKYIEEYGETLNGAVLSGTSGKQGIIIDFGILLSKKEIRKIGEKSQSHFLNKLSFGGYNKPFKPSRTDFDWLSRDEKEVDKYIDDPYCGTVFTAGFYYDLFKGCKEIHMDKNMKKIPKDLPVYIFSGESDPVGKNCKTVMWLINKYKSIGIKDVSHKIYPGGRHEMLNETNRDEVMNDVLNWLNGHI